MKVVGGIYSEYCYYPEWHQIFGSGGRGAAALTRLGVSDVTLHSAVALNHMGAVQATLSPYGVNVEAIAAKSLIEFSYTHPLSEPAVSPSPLQVHSIPLVESDIVLAYGMIESSIRVKGRHVVYDPQGGDDIRPPKDVAIAERLALVANEAEIRTLTRKKDVVEGARDVINTGQAEVVIVKQGPFGSTVVLADNTYAVPPFVTHNVFKIGSGDVFSAAFAKFWAYQGLSAFEAAENASRCAALYCDTKSIDAIAGFASFKNVGREKRKEPKVYLAGPFFSLSQRILIEEARRSFENLGVEVFSPMHEVGLVGAAGGAIEIAKQDLIGLDASTVVFASISDLDPGTLFEVGYARSKNIPVVVYAEGVKEEHLTMFVGSGCRKIEDFSSAIYNAIWEGM